MPAARKLLRDLALNVTTPKFEQPSSERLVEGNPLRTTGNHFECDGMSAGLWPCEFGAWGFAAADDTDGSSTCSQAASVSPTNAGWGASSGRVRRA